MIYLLGLGVHLVLESRELQQIPGVLVRLEVLQIHPLPGDQNGPVAPGNQCLCPPVDTGQHSQ